MSTASILQKYGFSRHGVDNNKLKKNYGPSHIGNFKLFREMKGDIGRGPKYPRTGIYIITKFSNKPTWDVLFARKCFGGDATKGLVGERYKVGHTHHYTKKRVSKYGKSSGAAGTQSQYWGKWVTIGGKNDSKARNNFEAALSEFKDEAGCSSRVSSQLHFIKSFTYANTLIYIAYLPPKYALELDTSRGTHKKLIFDSHGEIAELRWVSYDKVLGNQVMKNGLASYVESTYLKKVLPFMKTLTTL